MIYPMHLYSILFNYVPIGIWEVTRIQGRSCRYVIVSVSKAFEIANVLE